jgi:hypothetical protein
VILGGDHNFPGSPPKGQDEVKSISVSNFEMLTKAMVEGKLGKWYRGWKSVPEESQHVQDLNFVFTKFKGGAQPLLELKVEDVSSHLIRAYLLAGNEHPAKSEDTKHLFSHLDPEVATTYEWSSNFTSVLKGLKDEQLVQRLGISNPRFFLDVLFIDQLSKKVTVELAMAQATYIKAPVHVALASETLLDRGWCIFELCLRYHAKKPTYFVGNLGNKEAGYDYLKQMKLYSEADRKSIYWSLNRIFNFDDGKINQAILNQAGIQDSSRDNVIVTAVRSEAGVSDHSQCVCRCIIA